MNSSFEKWFSKNKDSYVDALLRYLSLDTTSPQEHLAWQFLHEQLTARSFIVKKQSINPKIWEHPYHCTKTLSQVTNESYNIVAKRFYNVSNTIVINCHIDVVPAPNFSPEVRDDIIFGRGACDTKSNFIMVLGALDFIHDQGDTPNKNIVFHLPIEEEIGGNGTLSLTQDKDIDIDIDAAIVLEPTNLEVFRGHRGCLTFQISLSSEQKHMGTNTANLNAIDLGISVIDTLKRLEQDLLVEARKNQDFSKWEKPLQLNIGTIKGGEWHGSLPEKTVITGNLGFLPNYTIENVMHMIKTHVHDTVSCCNGNVHIDFNSLKNDSYVMPINEKIVQELLSACRTNGLQQDDVYAWNVSCDARMYYKEQSIPTIIFGCGQLENAHSKNENVSIKELKLGMKILSDFLLGGS